MAGARKPEELDAWRLAWELKERVFAFTATGPAFRDCKFREEIREAARSASDNISEGFYRYSAPDFANFLRYARGSLGEVRNQLRHARAEKYLNETEFNAAHQLCGRALGAVTGLRNYLLDCPKDFDPRRLNPDSETGNSQPDPGAINPEHPDAEPEP